MNTDHDDAPPIDHLSVDAVLNSPAATGRASRRLKADIPDGMPTELVLAVAYDTAVWRGDIYKNRLSAANDMIASLREQIRRIQGITSEFVHPPVVKERVPVGEAVDEASLHPYPTTKKESDPQ